MKTKWRLYILWSVLSLGLLSWAMDTYEPPFTRRKNVFKLGTAKSKSIKLSTGDRKSAERLPASTSPSSQLRSQRPYPPMRPGEPEAKIPSDFVHLPDVSVTCSTSDFVVRVKPAFYGLGADAAELKLGSTCKSNGVLRPYGDLLFTYPLTACDAVRRSPRGYLVYKFVLHFEPSPKRFPRRAHRLDVDIECRYERNHHVHQLTVQPTWQNAVVSKRLKGSPNDFQIELMDDSWSRPAMSPVHQLGKTVHFQVSAPHLPTGGKLYINSCYATPSSGPKSSRDYTIIDNFGCMLDSKRDPGASQFISRTNKTLRFSLEAFHFTSDPDVEVNLHCKLSVTSEDPGPAHKSCTYGGNGWTALTGDDSICECCESQCVTSKSRRAMMEGSASSGSLLVSDQPYTADDGFLPVSPSPVYHYIDELHSHESLWESADVVKQHDDEEEQVYTDEEEQLDEEGSGVILEVMAEPDLGFREEESKSEEMASNQFEEDGSGYIVQERFSESEEEAGFKGGDDDGSEVQQATHLIQKEGEVLEQILPSEVSLLRASVARSLPLVSEGEEENGKHSGKDEEADRMMASEVEWKEDGLADLVDGGEMTWYFTWG